MQAHRADFLHNQRGVALITVLLLVAILTTLIVRSGFSNQLWLRQAENIVELSHARQAARATELWIVPILEQDKNGFDALSEFWARSLPPVPLDRGSLRASITDLQGRFNLNNLVGNDGRPDELGILHFKRLLQILELDTGIADAIIDWIDTDDIQTGSRGAEDGYYQGLKPSYLPPNQDLNDITELQLIRGVDQYVWSRLSPHVTALPQATAVNVNTATPEVLAAVVTEWGDPFKAYAEAVRWTGSVAFTPVTSINDFIRRGLERDSGDSPPGLDVASRYFVAFLDIEFGRVGYGMETIYFRNQGRVIVLAHRRRWI